MIVDIIVAHNRAENSLPFSPPDSRYCSAGKEVEQTDKYYCYIFNIRLTITHNALFHQILHGRLAHEWSTRRCILICAVIKGLF